MERSPGLPMSAACIGSLVLGVVSILFAAPGIVFGAVGAVFALLTTSGGVGP